MPIHVEISMRSGQKNNTFCPITLKFYTKKRSLKKLSPTIKAGAHPEGNL